MQLRRRALGIVLATALSSGGCGSDDSVSLLLYFNYLRATCNDAAAADVPIHEPGTVTIHIVDVETDNALLASDCFHFAGSDTRTLRDLPGMFTENVNLTGLPEGATIQVEISLYAGEFLACTPYMPGSDGPVPRMNGHSGNATLSEMLVEIAVDFGCLDQ